MSIYFEIINDIKPKMKETILFFEKEAKEMRTSRVSPSLIENFKVEHYGVKSFLKQVANISVSGERSLIIQPWDSSYLKPIEKAILTSNLSLSPIIDGKIIRIQLPALTEEHRQNLLKLLSERIENTKIIFRQHREKAWKEIQIKTREGEISKDDMFRAKDSLQKIINEYGDMVDKIKEKKEKEILTV